MSAEPKIMPGETRDEPRPVEKKEASIDIDLKNESEPDDDRITDLFVSFPPTKGIEPEENILTARAVLTGMVLGSLVNASNVYLGMLPYMWHQLFV